MYSFLCIHFYMYAIADNIEINHTVFTIKGLARRRWAIDLLTLGLAHDMEELRRRHWDFMRLLAMASTDMPFLPFPSLPPSSGSISPLVSSHGSAGRIPMRISTGWTSFLEYIGPWIRAS
jgi:hypothetical protein